MRNRFNQGDIVYWHKQVGNEHSVGWGMVDEQYYDRVYVDILEPKETTYINGVLLTDFQSETRYKKLPKDWTYNTVLYKTEHRTEELEPMYGKSMANPDDVKWCYDNGYLVKASTKFHGVIEEEINQKGYRIIKTHPMHKHHITSVAIVPDKLYYTYQEAEKEVKAYNDELIRQSQLTDREWLLEEVDKVLSRCFYSDFERERYKEWLLDLDNFEDIEVRCWYGEIQYKHNKNKKWLNIEI